MPPQDPNDDEDEEDEEDGGDEDDDREPAVIREPDEDMNDVQREEQQTPRRTAPIRCICENVNRSC
jgi:hypothetical protein